MLGNYPEIRNFQVLHLHNHELATMYLGYCTNHCIYLNTGWRTKYHTIDCARNKFLLLQKHLTPGTELILIGWKIVPTEEHVQCDHRFASQPLANEPFHSSQLFDTSLQKARYISWPPLEARKCSAGQGPHSEVVPRAF